MPSFAPRYACLSPVPRPPRSRTHYSEKDQTDGDSGGHLRRPDDAPAEDSESPKPSLPHKKSPIHSSKSETRLNREMVEMKYKQLGLKMEQDAEAARVRTALPQTLLQLTKDEIQLLTTTQ